MNLHSVAIWHPRDSNGVVFRVWLFSQNNREPDLLDESNEEDEEFSFDERFSHANPLAMAKRHKVVRSEELPIFVQEPLWFELFRLIPKFWITEELLYVGHGNAALGHNMSCWQCGRLRNPVLDS